MMGLLERLHPSLKERVGEAGRIAQEMGWRAYLVGGAVRDLLLGRPSLDVDIVVEGDGVAVAQRLASGARLVVHRRFGTAKVRGDGWSIDLATARRESYPHPGALPVVAPGTIQEDLCRRDFTINAMALSITPPLLGQLLDPFHGQGDLTQGLIRVLHPRSFIDDATRILRAVRYEQRFGFRLEAETQRLLRQHRDYLDTISADRLRRELELMLREESPQRAVGRAGELGVMERLGLPIANPEAMARRFQAARAQGNPTPLLYLCLLAYPLTPADLESFLARQGFPPAAARTLRDTLRLKEALPSLPTPPGQVVPLLEDFTPNAIAATALCSPSAQETLRRYLQEWRYVKAPLTGEDLLALGVPSGPPIGQTLRRLQLARLDGLLKTREEAEALVRRWLRP